MQTTTPRRVLIMSCSATKNRAPDLLPASSRYDGSGWRTLRATLETMPAGRHPVLLVLSARFGLIPAERRIPPYDAMMTAGRAVDLVDDADSVELASRTLAGAGPVDLYVFGGALYRRAVRGILSRTSYVGSVHTSPGRGIGYQLADLKRWLVS
jgi:hypothetical protein